jgi:WhiB family redox-sensing transcriptional regulator
VAIQLPIAPTWQDQAACRGVNVSLFFPAGEDTALIASARAVCNACPVAGPCLQAGLYEPEGIWGGRTSEERKRLRLQGSRAPG